MGSLNIAGFEYNWLASLVSIVVSIGLVALGRKVLFGIGPISRTYEFNRGRIARRSKPRSIRGG